MSPYVLKMICLPHRIGRVDKSGTQMHLHVQNKVGLTKRFNHWSVQDLRISSTIGQRKTATFTGQDGSDMLHQPVHRMKLPYCATFWIELHENLELDGAVPPRRCLFSVQHSRVTKYPWGRITNICSLSGRLYHILHHPVLKQYLSGRMRSTLRLSQYSDPLITHDGMYNLSGHMGCARQHTEWDLQLMT